jgi:hypothetical protein
MRRGTNAQPRFTFESTDVLIDTTSYICRNRRWDHGTEAEAEIPKHRDIEIEISKEKKRDSRESNHTGNSPTLRLSQSRDISAHLIMCL